MSLLVSMKIFLTVREILQYVEEQSFVKTLTLSTILSPYFTQFKKTLIKSHKVGSRNKYSYMTNFDLSSLCRQTRLMG